MQYIVVPGPIAIKLKDLYFQGSPISDLVTEFSYSLPVIRRTIIKLGGVIRPRGRPAFFKPVLSNKLEQLSSSLGEPVNADVLKTIVNYALRHNDGRTFRKIDRRYNYEGALSQFRREYLESSYYVMGRIWRAVYRTVYLQNQGKLIKVSDYGVHQVDLDLCFSVLNDEDLAKISAWLEKTGDYVFLPNEVGVQRVVADCEKSMKGIVASKLRFIYQYDPAYEAEDLVSYLRVIAYRVAVKYDWEMLDGEFAYKKCLNYTKRSLWNAAFAIIKENTGDDYKRLERVGTDEREYRITTVSMDTAVDDDRLSIEEQLGEDPDTSCEIRELVKGLGNEKLNQLIRLDGEDVPEFTAFVLAGTGKDENDLYTENFALWREMAHRFTGLVKREDRVDYKRKILKSLDLWERRRVGRSHVTR